MEPTDPEVMAAQVQGLVAVCLVLWAVPMWLDPAVEVWRERRSG